MAVGDRQDAPGGRLAKFGLTTAAIGPLASFYETAFGCRRLTTERVAGSAFENLMGVRGGAIGVSLGLGHQIIELLQFDRPGKPYPSGAGASDLVFQHFAIAVRDMDAAYARLLSVEGWTPISTCGPERLPEAAGGVTAFKFRDPEGHPLELLAFPNARAPTPWQSGDVGPVRLGIDHSAISVSDPEASIAFYERLGLRVSTHTVNHGREQQRLDSVEGVQVDVIALTPLQPTPHLELLGYRRAAHGPALRLQSNDIAASRLFLESLASHQIAEGSGHRLEDPDGHHIFFRS